VLVHGYRAGGERRTRQGELPVGELLQALVVADLPADRVQGALCAGVLVDGGADLGVEPGDLCGDGTRLVPVLLERAGASVRRRGRDDACGGDGAQRGQRDQRQSTYQVAVLQYASSRSLRRAPPACPTAPSQAGLEGQSRNLALAVLVLKREIPLRLLVLVVSARS
jgi:hypothetical protein